MEKVPKERTFNQQDLKCVFWKWNCHRRVVSNPWVPEVEYYLCFTGRLRSSQLSNPSFYSDYQQFLYDTIIDFRSKGQSFKKTVDWFNEICCRTARGKVFRSSHVYSILKKKWEQDEKDNKPIELEYGKLSMRFIDRTIVNSD